MTRRPFDPNEADVPRDLEPTVSDLERYVADSASDPTPDLADRVMREVAVQPTPRRGLLAVFAGMWAGDRGRMALLAATVAAAVLAVVVAGQLPRLLPSNIGGSPQPSVLPTMEPSPSFTVSPQPTEPATESEEPSDGPTDDEDESPSPSVGEDRTPRPSATPTGSGDNSGPGGGGDDHGGNSGPGGGSSTPSPQESFGSGGHSGPGSGSGSDG